MSRLLIGIVVLAALAVLPAREGSAFLTLYREPKGVVFSIFAWAWLAALFASPRGREVLASLPRVLGTRPVLAWLLWGGYMALSATWGAVTENALYELRTLVPALVWMVILLAWQWVEPRAGAGIRRALITASAVVTLIGAFQLWRPITWLPPIHPQLGGPHAGVFGFKNPAALAVLGQWFLVLHWAISSWHGARRRPWLSALATALCAGQALYIASLHSRTSLLALVAGLLCFGTGALLRRRPSAGAPSRLVAAAALGGVVALVAIISLVAPWREKALLGAEILMQPASYLESDRGIYLRNTLAMVERHPAGVGLGDWQTYYPVFRRHAREFAFDQQVEVRRAHSDHVQILGEGGWPGLGLWLAALGLTILGSLRRWRCSGDLLALALAAQLVAWTVAMCTDYVIEMPFHRYQFFLVVALALSAAFDESRARRVEIRPAWTPGRHTALALACVLGLAAVTEAWRGALLLARLRSAAFMTQTYQQGMRPGDAAALRRALEAGERFARLPGYTKSTPHDERVLAHLYWLHGAEPRAAFWLRRALEHQPYAPAGLDLASKMLERRSPAASDAYAGARDFVLYEAQEGFDRSYPRWPP